MSILLLVVVSTLVISAVCSLFEATLYSTRVATLETAKEKGRHTKSARVFWGMKRNISEPTSAILILNTIANTAGATVAGMLAAQEFGPGYVPIFSAVLTLAILMFSEIVPKTIGALHWRVLWPYIAWPLSTTQKALSPLIWLTGKFSSLLISSPPAAGTTGGEVLAMARLAAESGDLSSIELELLTAVFHFDSVLCREIMVPRNEVVILKKSWTIAEALESTKNTRHTRYPLCESSFDAPVGIIHVKDLLGLDDTTPLETVARTVRSVPETMPITRLLREMQSSHNHMAIVVDEHGTTVGIVALENILEQIVGSVQDEFDAEEPDVRPGGKRSHLVRGATPIAQINRLLEIDLPHPSEVDTIAGLLMREMGRLLEVGDKTEIRKITLEVSEVVGNRATKLRLTLPESSDEDDEANP